MRLAKPVLIPGKPLVMPVLRAAGGMLPGIDATSNQAVLAAMEA
jgi:hypothetical protein